MININTTIKSCHLYLSDIATEISLVAVFYGTMLSASVLAQGSDSALVLEEIIVTAQKWPQSLQDVPVAVSVFHGDKISAARILSLQEMSAYLPNFYQTQTPTSNVMFIRGIGSGPNPGFEQSVGMFHDGIY